MGVEPKTEVNAKKATYAKAEAVKLLAEVNQLYVAKGKNFVHLDLKKEKPSEEELLKLVLGPTGNLRAPTLKVGKRLLVGYHDQMYQDLLKG